MGLAQIRTLPASGDTTRSVYLGTLGPVDGLKYSYTTPGGCDALSAVLGIPPAFRTSALDPGRIVQAVLGASVVWEGTLDEPQQTDSGWAISAHGSGTWGASFNADFAGHWRDNVPDTAIGNAVARGLGWVPSAIGTPAGLYLGQGNDAGAVKIDDMLNQVCTPGGLIWIVKRLPRGNLCQVYPIPTAPTRLLVCTQPAPRTLNGDINAVEIRYNSVPDEGPGYPAKYDTVWATDDTSIAKHGRQEAFADVGSNGVMLPGDAQQIGTSVLQRYQRASYAGPFTVQPGELLTVGGQPVDLASYWCQGNEGPQVYRLILLDQGWGGEVTPGPVTFLGGAYEWDQAAQQATITPFQMADTDFASMLAARAAAARGRRVTVWRGQGAILWSFKGSRIWHRRRKHGYRSPQSGTNPIDGGGPEAGFN